MTKMIQTIARPLLCGALTVATGIAHAGGSRADDVREIENRWSEAFISGDAAILDALLDAQYVSVGATGNARPKAQIIALAVAYAKSHPGEHAKALPPTSVIRVIGDTALVQHRNSGDMSVDVFYFSEGQWHACYSQHTKRENAAN
jgi:hypothetical protein